MKKEQNKVDLRRTNKKTREVDANRKKHVVNKNKTKTNKKTREVDANRKKNMLLRPKENLFLWFR